VKKHHKKSNARAEDKLLRNYVRDLCYRISAHHDRYAEAELKKLLGDRTTKPQKRIAKHVQNFLGRGSNATPNMVTKLPNSITCPIPVGGKRLF